MGNLFCTWKCFAVRTPVPTHKHGTIGSCASRLGRLFRWICVSFVLFYGFAKIFQHLTGMTVMQWTEYKKEPHTPKRGILGVDNDSDTVKQKSTRKKVKSRCGFACALFMYHTS
jgi:hypothetical protein